MIVYLTDLREILNSPNIRCTIVYKQSFSCKINCTTVKQTATILHKSPDETDKAQSRSLLQMRNFDSDSGPSCGLRLHTPAVQCINPYSHWLENCYAVEQQLLLMLYECTSKFNGTLVSLAAWTTRTAAQILGILSTG